MFVLERQLNVKYELKQTNKTFTKPKNLEQLYVLPNIFLTKKSFKSSLKRFCWIHIALKRPQISRLNGLQDTPI